MVLNNFEVSFWFIYLISYGTIFVKQKYFAHLRFINEQRDCGVTRGEFKIGERQLVLANA